MRYRLRTLLILMAIIGLALSRISHLKQKRNSHRQEVAKLVNEISTSERKSKKHIEDSIQKHATGDTTLFFPRGTPERLPVYVIDNRNMAILAKDAATAELWSAAVFQQVLANRYDRAIFRPWLPVSEERAPQ